MDKKECTCINCGSGEYDVVYYYDDLPKFKQIGKKRDIVQCSECSLMYCNPRNMGESMLDIYENNYWQDYQTSVGEVEIKNRVSDFEFVSHERMGHIFEVKNSGKFLDVGCSQGFLVNEAKKLGYDSYGIDLNQIDIDGGSEMYGVNLEKSLLKNYDNGEFDIISSFNVIEHVSDPLEMLLEMRSRLKNDGVIVVGTHDVECSNHQNEGVNWKHIIPNEHLYFFSQDTIRTLADKAGLSMIRFFKPIDNNMTLYFKKK